MKAPLAVLLLLGGLVSGSVAAAAGVNLAWDACSADGGVSHVPPGPTAPPADVPPGPAPPPSLPTDAQAGAGQRPAEPQAPIPARTTATPA